MSGIDAAAAQSKADLLLYPTIDPVRSAAELGFTPEQLDFLVDIAKPRCCHVTGEHDPTHFAAGRYVCSFQLAEIAWRLLSALGLEAEPAELGHYRQRRVDPASASPRAGCPQCERAEP